MLNGRKGTLHTSCSGDIQIMKRGLKGDLQQEQAKHKEEYIKFRF